MTHFTRHTLDVMIKEKNKSKAPVIIAPIILVATNSIAKSITDVRIVPRIPVRKTDREGQRQVRGVLFTLRESVPTAKTVSRYTTDIPSNTHKNAGVRVITAVIRSRIVIIPMIMLAPIPRIGQVAL